MQPLRRRRQQSAIAARTIVAALLACVAVVVVMLAEVSLSAVDNAIAPTGTSDALERDRAAPDASTAAAATTTATVAAAATAPSTEGKTRPSQFANWAFDAHSRITADTLPVRTVDARAAHAPSDIPDAVYVAGVSPQPLAHPRLVALSDRAVESILNLNPAAIRAEADSAAAASLFERFVGGSYLPRNARPMAHNYAGHQFGSWAGQLGDGRAILLGETTSRSGQHWELQLKGSGRTPFSRDGDGRAVVRSSVRELLASEALYALGIPTTRALALVAGDETVLRDPLGDGHPVPERTAVLLRASPSWLRFGSFERFAAFGSQPSRPDIQRQLVQFLQAHHAPELVRKDGQSVGLMGRIAGRVSQFLSGTLFHASSNEEHSQQLFSKRTPPTTFEHLRQGSPLLRAYRMVADFVSQFNWARVSDAGWAAQLLAEEDPVDYSRWFVGVVNNTAWLVANWQAYGFAHGVCNTDNFSILGLTLDYGPFAFMEAYNPDLRPNASDESDMYTFSQQSSVAYTNLMWLAQALAELIPEQDRRTALGAFARLHEEYYLQVMRRRLGLDNEEDIDAHIVQEFKRLLFLSKADYSLSLRFLADIRDTHVANKTVPEHAWALKDIAQAEPEDFYSWLSMWYKRIHRNHNRDPLVTFEAMNAVNPRYILRNWMAQQAIEEYLGDGNSQSVQRLLDVLQQPFEVNDWAEAAGYASRPPSWAAELRVSCSS
ncbi:hypothetical protein CAOG_05172 [Capsaspora owczarzaki ATCC 30864]|uniref:Selenoprotein O n=1 Tax=Capsaspora owczarzaki (strain ATCC 30864) TaxID=595528 RepID=A0A0D2WRK2_CAPO3|nr:hypothetical protein CAOG_05172 [Capsaspora owczarzaki ATCC 30864]KJE94540.1 hypothetical protein CAOG_005172 [Capsaspora owczarzaki ATCC 30864]|eukprot:XP_004346857.1 hypothetical protein CAOG_05172 [Capsaspora owczarzaki ATCC 30864]